MELISEQRLDECIPELGDKVRAAAAALSLQGIFFRVAQGLRTYAEQDALYALGRTITKKPDGSHQGIVTNARGGYSNHNFGYAVDCYPFVAGSTGALDINDAKAPEFLAMVAALKEQGLVWGGDWVSIKDAPHFQLSTVPVTPSDADRAAFAQGGLPAVWARYQ